MGAPTMTRDNLGSSHAGTRDWMLQRVSGVALVVLLFLHFFVLHYATEGPVTYDKVMARLTSPAWKVIDITFVVFALYHAVNGFRAIIDDFVHRPLLKLILVGSLWVTATGFGVLGILTIATLTVAP